jgi:hypothetical protein
LKNTIILFLVFAAQASWACNCLSFNQAKEKALKENKFLLVHFSSSFHTNDKGDGIMTLPALDEEANKVADDYIYFCVHKGANPKLVREYNIKRSFELLILDANGFELFRFPEHVREIEIFSILTEFVIPTNFFANDLVSYHEKSTYNTALRVAQKYFDYTLQTSDFVRDDIIDLAASYLKIAEGKLSAKDENFKEKQQRLELFKLYRWAYERKFDVLNERINSFTASEITESNKSIFYFLKYISSKALNHDDFTAIETTAKSIDGFDYFVAKTNLILNKA